MEVKEPKAKKTESINSSSASVVASSLNSPLRSLSRMTKRSSGKANRIQRDDAESWGQLTPECYFIMESTYYFLAKAFFLHEYRQPMFDDIIK